MIYHINYMTVALLALSNVQLSFIFLDLQKISKTVEESPASHSDSVILENSNSSDLET